MYVVIFLHFFPYRIYTKITLEISKNIMKRERKKNTAAGSWSSVKKNYLVGKFFNNPF